MHVKELWRYPVKSMAGERVSEIEMTKTGFAGDRNILVGGPGGRVITSRTHHQLLGLKGSLGSDGFARINGHLWDSPEALALVNQAVGPNAQVLFDETTDRFDILPLLVTSDGAINHLGFDSRRFRPNIIVGGVEGLAERTWPGRRLRIGDTVIHAVQLRGRCVMTTYDPDTLKQDLKVLRRIVNELDGTLGLDSEVIRSGWIREGDVVTLLD